MAQGILSVAYCTEILQVGLLLDPVYWANKYVVQFDSLGQGGF